MTSALARFAQRIEAAKRKVAAAKAESAKASVEAASLPEAAPLPRPAPPSATVIPGKSDAPLADRGSVDKYRVTATLPAGARVAGDLVLQESIVLGGVVEGQIRIEGGGMAAFVKAGGACLGGIKASVVLVYGEVYGPVEADYIRVYAGGRIEGCVMAEAMTIDRGGVLINQETRVAPVLSVRSGDVASSSVIGPATASESRLLAEAVSEAQQHV